jgi:hypothetical protein
MLSSQSLLAEGQRRRLSIPPEIARMQREPGRAGFFAQRPEPSDNEPVDNLDST